MVDPDKLRDPDTAYADVGRSAQDAGRWTREHCPVVPAGRDTAPGTVRSSHTNDLERDPR